MYEGMEMLERQNEADPNLKEPKSLDPKVASILTKGIYSDGRRLVELAHRITELTHERLKSANLNSWRLERRY